MRSAQVTRTERHRRRSLAALGVVAAALLALPACGSDGDGDGDGEATPRTSTTSASPSQTVDAREAKATKQVLSTYNSYREANLAAAATADYNSKEIAKYVGEPLLGQLINGLFKQHQQGIVTRGRPVGKPTVTAVRLADTPPLTSRTASTTPTPTRCSRRPVSRPRCRTR